MKKRSMLAVKQTEEIQEQMKRAKKTREYRRLQAIYLYGTGSSIEEAARITQFQDRSITRLYDKYLESGLSSLTDAPMEGRPRRLTAEQELALKEVILNNSPVEYGFSAYYNWTATLAKEYIKQEYGVGYSIKGVTKIFKRLNLSYTRPTYTLAKADPEKQEQFREDFWKVKTFGKHRGIKLVGCLDYESGGIYCEEHESYNAQTFFLFLEKVLQRYDGRIIMVLDNARIHHAKLLLPFLNLNKERLTLMFLPPYSPKLNLIEGLWKWLKERIINNVFYNKTYEISKNVEAFLYDISKCPDAVINRLCLAL